MTVDHNSIGGLRVLIVVIMLSQEHMDIGTHARTHARTCACVRTISGIYLCTALWLITSRIILIMHLCSGSCVGDAVCWCVPIWYQRMRWVVNRKNSWDTITYKSECFVAGFMNCVVSKCSTFQQLIFR